MTSRLVGFSVSKTTVNCKPAIPVNFTGPHQLARFNLKWSGQGVFRHFCFLFPSPLLYCHETHSTSDMSPKHTEFSSKPWGE